jgi:hypothetical protein
MSSTNLVVSSSLNTTENSQVQDSNGNSSPLFLAQNNVVIAGPGGANATASLSLSTFAPNGFGPADTKITATDVLNFQASLAFMLNTVGGQGGLGQLKAVLVLNPNGTIAAPLLSKLPPAGQVAPLVIDSKGNISVGTVVVTLPQ